LDEEGFMSYWKEHHAPLVAQIPGVTRYVITPIVRSAFDAGQEYHGLAELYFPSEEALAIALRTPESKATVVDTQRFIDRDSIVRFVGHEQVIVSGE
jgi:uncharacterized protein (TIGR02118 family)